MSGRPTKCLVGALPHQVLRHAHHLAAGPSVGDVQSLFGLVLEAMQKWVQPGSMHQDDVGGPFLLHVGLQVSYWLLGLGLDGDDGRGCRACLAPDQVLGGVDEAGLGVEMELVW